MTDRVFVDTNVLLYAHDVDAEGKHEKAVGIVRDLWSTRLGILSTQVLQEFYVNVTRKIPSPLSKSEAREIVRDFGAWEVKRVELEHVVRASEIEERHRLSFWDALIVCTAAAAGASRILSEDLTHGRRIEGVLIENPFE